jgi:hypothetical protein
MLSADEEIRSILDDGHALQAASLLAALGLTGNPLARLAVRSWLVFVVTACVDWQDNAEVTRPQVRDLCVETLLQLPSHHSARSCAATVRGNANNGLTQPGTSQPRKWVKEINQAIRIPCSQSAVMPSSAAATADSIRSASCGRTRSRTSAGV